MKPFVIDVFSVGSDNEIQKRRYESDSFESAIHMMKIRSDLPGTSRIVISRRIGGNGRQISKMKVWSR